MIDISLTEKQAVLLQDAVDEHMARCWEVIDYEGEDLPEYLDDVAMYCGCNVCETREHLMAVFNWFRFMDIADIAVA